MTCNARLWKVQLEQRPSPIIDTVPATLLSLDMAQACPSWLFGSPGNLGVPLRLKSRVSTLVLVLFTRQGLQLPGQHQIFLSGAGTHRSTAPTCTGATSAPQLRHRHSTPRQVAIESYDGIRHSSMRHRFICFARSASVRSAKFRGPRTRSRNKALKTP